MGLMQLLIFSQICYRIEEREGCRICRTSRSQVTGRWWKGWASCSSRYFARYVANRTREKGAEDAEPLGQG
jgi:hypothetical protein